MSWFETWFDDDYLALYSHRNSAEAALNLPLLEQYLPATSRVLDIACGAARYSSLLASRGFDVIGIDLSWSLLQVARKTVDTPVSFLRADMRALPFANETFGAALSLFNSFGYLESDLAHRSMLLEWRRVLTPHAPLLIDYFERDALIAGLERHSVVSTGDSTFHIERSLSVDGLRIEKRVAIQRPDRPDRHILESVRLYTPREIGELLQ
ncbi:MAG: methyltransferase domain-containing protein, partial [Deltaproteobacteria bacterium]|nr:methyltransferase domain-containing protein [Deltaproteobacteria bacterium]